MIDALLLLEKLFVEDRCQELQPVFLSFVYLNCHEIGVGAVALRLQKVKLRLRPFDPTV